jgi:hypothetical protein
LKTKEQLIEQKYCLICEHWEEDDEYCDSNCGGKSNYIQVDEPLLSERYSEYQEKMKDD